MSDAPISPDALREALLDAPYHRALGLEVEAIEEEVVRLRLPFAEANSNPGGVLHGGVAASLLAIGSRAVAQRVHPVGAGPWTLGQLQVSYQSAAREEDVLAEARLQRRGRALCFVETRVTKGDGSPIAAATAVVRARFARPVEDLPRTAGDDGATEPGPLADVLAKAPFMSNRRMSIEHMADAHSRVTMPACDANAAENGAIHEGAILALLDTAGAMASWATAGLGRWKASTASLQAQSLAPPPAGDVVAYGRCVHRDQEMYWSDVEVAEVASGRVTTRGTVFYRLAE